MKLKSFSAVFSAAAMMMVAFFSQSALAGSSEELAKLFDDYWAYEMREDPFAATGSGMSDYNDQVPAVAPEDHARRAGDYENFMARLAAIDLSDVSDDERLSADLFHFILKHNVALAPFKGWRIPFLADTGFHSNIGYVVGATSFKTEADYRTYLKRLRNLPTYINQNVENMRQGLADGFTQPKEIIPLILPSFEAQVTRDVADHPLYAPFKEMPASISKSKQKALKRDATLELKRYVIPAYARALAFMRDEYAPAAQDVVGAAALPDGRGILQSVGSLLHNAG